MSRQVTVPFEFNREADAYEAKCPWCEEVVATETVEHITEQMAPMPADQRPPMEMWLGPVQHECWVEP